MLCVVSVAGFGGGWHWVLDLTSHFRPQYAVLLAGAVIVCLWRGARFSAAVAMGCLALQIGTLVPLWLRPDQAAAATGSSMRILLANVHTTNRDFAAVRALLEREVPDVVVLQETDRTWLDALAGVRARWPHRVEEARADNFGIAVWSRHPLADARIVRFSRAGEPSVVARVQRGDETFVLVATHPIPPAGGMRTALRDEALAALAAFTSAQAEPVLVVGDLNCTPWSPRYRTLLRDGRLRDSGEGHGWQPTWPSRLSVFGIPLDHCLYGAGLRIRDRVVGPDIGSDHRPLIVDVAVVSGR